MWKNIRKITLTTLAIAIHFWTIFQIAIQNNLINTIIGILLFFIIFHIQFIDRYKKDFSKFMLFVLAITFLEVLWTNTFAGGNIVLGIIIINFSTMYLAYTLKQTADKSVFWNSPDYFWNGGYLFTLGITIACSLFTIGIYNNFPFSCKDLKQSSDKIVQIVSKPLNISLPKDTDTSKILNDTKVTDLLDIGKTLNIESDKKGITILENFKTRKNNLITKTIDENKELNQGICEYTLNKLQTKLKNPGFQTGVIVLMVAILYPFLRIMTQIMSVLGLVLFEILKICKGYHIEKIKTEVEKIG